MPEYESHKVWSVTVNGFIEVEAIDEASAVNRAQALFIAGQGSLTFNATLHNVLIELPPPPPA